MLIIYRGVVTFGEQYYSQKNLAAVCGPTPKTLTLFMAKLGDFLPYPIYARNIIFF